MSLSQQLKAFTQTVANELSRKIHEKGKDTGFTSEKGIKVKGEYYVEGRRISHITDSVLVAEGYHYQHHCIEVGELCEIIDKL